MEKGRTPERLRRDWRFKGQVWSAPAIAERSKILESGTERSSDRGEIGEARKIGGFRAGVWSARANVERVEI